MQTVANAETVSVERGPESSAPPSRVELLWRQYALDVDLYKVYLDLAIKLNAFYYAITGAILSFYFSRPPDPLLKWSLVLPLVMSISFFFFFLFGLSRLDLVRKELAAVVGELGLRVFPDLRVLVLFLGIFSLVFFLVAVGLAALLLCH